MEATIEIKVKNKNMKRIIAEVSKKLTEKFGKKTDDLALVSYKKKGVGRNAVIKLKYVNIDRTKGRIKNGKNISADSRRQEIDREKSKNPKRRKPKILAQKS